MRLSPGDWPGLPGNGAAVQDFSGRLKITCSSQGMRALHLISLFQAGEFMKFPSVLLAGLLGALVLALPAAVGEKIVVGWIEKVRIYSGNFLVHAKLDSGAEYSSLDAANLTQFDRAGQP